MAILSATVFVINVYATSDDEGKKDCSQISEPDDDFYCDDFDWEPYHPSKELVDEMCDASEDYAKNPDNCDRAYDMVDKEEEKEQKYNDDGSHDLDGNPNTGIEIDDPVGYSHERNVESEEVHNETPEFEVEDEEEAEQDMIDEVEEEDYEEESEDDESEEESNNNNDDDDEQDEEESEEE